MSYLDLIYGLHLGLEIYSLTGAPQDGTSRTSTRTGTRTSEDDNLKKSWDEDVQDEN